MIEIVTGLPGSGKSFFSARRAVEILHRNREWNKKTGKLRLLSSNLKLAKFVEDEFPGQISYWDDPSELVGMKNVDILWEEMGTHVDATQWANMPLELKRFLQQHRHRGVEIYGNVQEFSQVDISVRRLTHRLVYLQKLIGSRDPSPTSPPVKFVWGLINMKDLDPRDYKEDEKLKSTSNSFGLDISFLWPWNYMLLDRKTVDIFDMFNDIKRGKYPPLQHQDRYCLHPGCQYHKVIHA